MHISFLILDELSVELAGTIKIAKVNVMENTELAAKFGVHKPSLPSRVQRWTGERSDGGHEQVPIESKTGGLLVIVRKGKDCPPHRSRCRSPESERTKQI